MPKYSRRFSYPKMRFFGGKRFTFQGSQPVKSVARLHAKTLRDAGNKARVVKRYDVYLIYARK